MKMYRDEGGAFPVADEVFDGDLSTSGIEWRGDRILPGLAEKWPDLVELGG